MNLYDAILRDDPVVAYLFGTVSATSFVNLMGDSNAMSVPQNAGVNASIYPGSMISGPGNSMILGNGWAGQITLPDRFNSTYTRMPFTLELMVKFLEPTVSASKLMTHASSVDGLYFDQNYIYFRVDLASGGNVTVSWPIPTYTQNYHVIGTYNGSKIALYVDGESVATAVIPDGETLATKSSQVLYVGEGTAKVLIEAPAAYDKELSATQVANHFIASRQNIIANDAVAAFNGRFFKFTDSDRDVTVTDSVDWSTEGLADNVQPGEYLLPLYGSDDLSQAGTFTYAVPSADLQVGQTYQGMKLEWNGDGNFTVQFSIDNGTTWSTATNGVVQAGTVGLSTNIPPQVKITFAAGRAKDLDVVRSLTATVYSSFVIRPVNDSERKIIVSDSGANTSSYWAEPIEMDDRAGLLINNAHAVLQESTDVDLTNVGTVEMWVKFSNTVNNIFMDGRFVTPSNPAYLSTGATSLLAWPATLSAVYVNGVAQTNATFTPVAGRLYHIVGVWATPFNAKLDFESTGAGLTNLFNLIATYEAQLTAAQVLALYKSYFGPPALAISDANTIVVGETAPAAKAYVNDWSIQGAG